MFDVCCNAPWHPCYTERHSDSKISGIPSSLPSTHNIIILRVLVLIEEQNLSAGSLLVRRLYKCETWHLRALWLVERVWNIAPPSPVIGGESVKHRTSHNIIGHLTNSVLLAGMYSMDNIQQSLKGPEFKLIWRRFDMIVIPLKISLEWYISIVQSNWLIY